MREPPYFKVGDRVKAIEGNGFDSGKSRWNAGVVSFVSVHLSGPCYDGYMVLIDNSGNTEFFGPEMLVPLTPLEDLAASGSGGGWTEHDPCEALYGNWE